MPRKATRRAKANRSIKNKQNGVHVVTELEKKAIGIYRHVSEIDNGNIDDQKRQLILKMSAASAVKQALNLSNDDKNAELKIKAAAIGLGLGGCPGCQIRKTGCMMEPLPTSPTDQHCILCLESRAEVDKLSKSLLDSLKYEPQSVKQMYKQYAPWKRYVFKNLPDSAVRIISLRHILSQHVIDYYCPKNQSDLNFVGEQLGTWTNLYNHLILDSLPENLLTGGKEASLPQGSAASNKASLPQGFKASNEASLSIGELIMQYADPSIFDCLCVRLDENYKTQDQNDNDTGGWIFVPGVLPDALIEVEGWSHKVLTTLCAMPSTNAYLFCAPFGFQLIREYVRAHIHA